MIKVQTFSFHKKVNLTRSLVSSLEIFYQLLCCDPVTDLNFIVVGCITYNKTTSGWYGLRLLHLRPGPTLSCVRERT